MAGDKTKKNFKQKEDGDKVKKLRETILGEGEDANEENTEDDQQDFKGRIDVHTLNYFKRVEKLLEEDSFEDAESRELFLSNVLAQVGEGLRTCQLAKHRLTCKILETLFVMCNSKQFLGLFKSLMEDALVLSNDRFGSHVIEKAVNLIPVHIDCETDEIRIEIEETFRTFVTVTKKNLSELMRNTYSSHIVSSLMQVLGGINVSDTVSRSRNSRMTRGKFFKDGSTKKGGNPNFGSLFEEAIKPAPESFQKMLHKIAKKVRTDDNFGELLCHKNASPVIQTLLLALKQHDPKMCRSICNIVVDKSRILEWARENEENSTTAAARVPILFADEVGSHVMEKIFHVASVELYEVLVSKCFEKNLLQFALHPLANYILQHMLVNIPTKEMASDAIEELMPFTEDILASGNMGVIVRIAELCNRYQCKQKEFVKALRKAVHLPIEKEKRNSFLKLLLTLSTYDVMFETKKEDNKDAEMEDDSSNETEAVTGVLTKETMNYHGACLAKTLFHFDDPKILVKSLLNLDTELLFLTRHEYGSFVIEEFFMSKTVQRVNKKKLLAKLQDNLITMATDKFGSHVVDKLWNLGDEDERKSIKEELYRSRSLLKGNMYGRIILRNCGIDSFQLPYKGRNERKTNVKKSEDEEKHAEGNNKKKRKKETNEELEKNDECAGVKKARKAVSSRFDEEIQKLGVCVVGDDDDDDLLQLDAVITKKFEPENSNEIDDLFAKAKLTKKSKKKKTLQKNS